jgi:cell division protein FtsW (lipid II flippase)
LLDGERSVFSEFRKGNLMPYKDLERKKEWEWLHRPQRLARRRELRRIEAEQQAARPSTVLSEHHEVGLPTFAVPLIAGVGLAAAGPKLGMALGGLTLLVAAIYKKGWQWWVLGMVVLILAIFFHIYTQNESRSGATK